MNYLKDSFVKMFNDLALDMLNFAFNFITDLLLNAGSLDQYLDYSRYLKAVQVIAGSLLTLFVVYQAFKRLSGNLIFEGDSKPISTIVMQTIISAALIYLMPYSLTNILMPANIAIVNLIQDLGVPVGDMSLLTSNYLSMNKVVFTGIVMVLVLIILTISFMIIGIVSGIRYAELFVALLVSPIIAVQFVNKQSVIGTWYKEVISIVFSQSIHILLLQLLVAVITISNPFISLTLIIGIIALMIRGPKVIKQYIYSTGAGTTMIGGVSGAGRMVAMSRVLSK